MVSIKEKMQALEAKVAESTQELVAIHTACDDYKVEIEATKADLEAAKAAMDAMVAEKVALEEGFKAELQAKDESLAQANAAIEGMQAQMELAPLADAEAKGVDPIAEGGEADEVDHVAACSKLSGAARISYYREHQKEIDAAYRRG